MDGLRQFGPLRGMRFAAWCFPVLLLFVAFFCLGGDLGRYYDDYVFAGRNPDLNAVDWTGNPWRHAPFFWRPLLFPFLYYLLAIFWHSMWVVHVLNVLAHAAVVGALYAFLRQCTATRQAAAAAALLFAVFPLHLDIVFWSTAITCSIPAALTLVMLNLFVRYIKGTTNKHLGWLIALAFIIPCWYEQPITLLPMLPFLVLAFKPATTSFAAAARRGLMAIIPMGLMVCAYLTLMVITTPAGRRGGASSFVHADELPGRIAFVAKAVVHLVNVELVEYSRGGIETAWTELSTPRGIMLICLLLTSAGWWSTWFVHQPAATTSTHSSRQRLLCSLFGLGWFVLAWLPFVPIRDQWVTPRCWHVPLLGVSIALAMAMDALLTSGAARRRPMLFRGVLASCTIAATWPGALALCGWQVLYRTRFRADQQQMAQLRQRIPSPPAAAVFVPMEDAFRAGKTKSLLFNVGLLSWTGSDSTVTGALRNTYGRSDLYSTRKDFWNPLPLTNVTETSFAYGMPIYNYRDGKGGAVVPWTMAIPFCISADGHVEIVDRIEVRWRGITTVITPPLAAAAAAGPTRTFVIERND
ncbi:MAG: hypothetical protein NTV94_17000 [Planctomycetota bacterium]|nr:hypothetical protein [Planctomycetota bacterium]